MAAAQTSQLRVAVVHDWLTNLAGAEKVVIEVLKIFPQADIYTSVYRPEAFGKIFKDHTVQTSFLQKVPFAKKKHQLFPVLRRYAFEAFDFSSYDIVISSSTAEGKGIITPESTLHISYIHTPTRYFWSHYNQYLKDPGFGLLDPLVRFQLKRTIKASRRWDYAAAQRPDLLLANSVTVQKRIEKYYKRSSQVVYPPVDTARFSEARNRPADAPEAYFVVASRLIPYKRFDIAVQACQKAGKRLVVVGGGSELKKLQQLADDTVLFKGHAPDDELVAYVQHADALLFPGEEDFGIAPVEAMAAGTPVLAYAAGGATETVVPGKTGELIDAQSVAAFARVLTAFRAEDYSRTELREHAENFSRQAFRTTMEKIIRERVDVSGSIPT
ncbi:MAG: hypothetical protein QG658_349 [Patescibacteria group bacterium]|nr:hypothetical protein [Patescibacteria group bacterium]